MEETTCFHSYLIDVLRKDSQNRKKEFVRSESLRPNLTYFRSEVNINKKTKANNWLFQYSHISRVFLLCQLWIVNYSVKSSSNNLSNENINTGVFVVFKTKPEWKCQNELLLKYNFSGNTSFYLCITEIIWRTFDRIIDNP